MYSKVSTNNTLEFPSLESNHNPIDFAFNKSQTSNMRSCFNNDPLKFIKLC